VDFPHAVAIVIARPLMLAVIDRSVRQLQPVVAAVLIRIDHHRAVWHGFGQNALTSRLVAVGDHPTAFFAALPADHVNDWWAVVVKGAMPRLFIRAAARQVVRIVMRRTFFPPRFGTARRPRRCCRPSSRLGRYRLDWFGGVGAR